MDYGTQNQQQQAQKTGDQNNQQQQNTQQTTQQQNSQQDNGQQQTQQANDDQITLDDLFPSDDKSTQQQQNTQQQNTQQQQQAGDPATLTPEQKAAAEVETKLKESEQRLNQTVTNSVEQMTVKIERNNQLTNFFANPDNEPFRKFQNEIVKVATDPRFINISVDRAVALALGPKAMMKLGAEIGADAANKAKGNSTGGNQNVQRFTQTNGPDYSKMSNEEFEARTQAVIRGEKVN